MKLVNFIKFQNNNKGVSLIEHAFVLEISNLKENMPLAENNLIKSSNFKFPCFIRSRQSYF